MLVLTRKAQESVMVGDEIEVVVLGMTAEKVRIGIIAPGDVPVFRREVWLERAGLDDSDRASVDAALEKLAD
jgi:carbon storage regulator